MLTRRSHEALERHVLAHYEEQTPLDVFMLPQPSGELRASLLVDAWEQPTSCPGWQRVWTPGVMGAHCILTNNFLAPHRASIGVGVERAFRRKGIARVLMQTAIAFAAANGVEWIDGYAVTTNLPILALDFSLGFERTGKQADAFRYGGASHDVYLLTKHLVS